MANNESGTDRKNTGGIASQKSGTSTRRQELLREIGSFTQIPELEKYFTDALKKARETFKHDINQYRSYQDRAGTGTESQSTDPLGSLSTYKSYFFEAIRVQERENEPGYRWQIEKCKLKVPQDIYNAIFSPFLNKVENIQPVPTRIHSELVELPGNNKSVQLNFTKSSDNRVSGFIKLVAVDERIPDNYILKEGDNVVKVKFNELKDEDMLERVVQLLKKDKGFLKTTFISLIEREMSRKK